MYVLFNDAGLESDLPDSTGMLGSRPRGSPHGRLRSTEAQRTAADDAVTKVSGNFSEGKSTWCLDKLLIYQA